MTSEHEGASPPDATGPGGSGGLIEGDLTLQAEGTSRNLTTVATRLNDRPAHADTINLARAINRRRYAAALVKHCPALDAGAVETELLELRDDLANRRGEAAGSAAPPAPHPTDPTLPTGGDAGGEPEDDRVAAVITTDEFRANDQAVAALAAADDLFTKGGRLVRVVRAGDGRPGGDPTVRRIVRPDEAPAVLPLKPPLIRDALTRVARFVKETGEGHERRVTPVHPSRWLVDAVSALGEYPGVRPLNGIAAGPVLRPNGTILNSPGYDPDTGLYLPAGAVAGVPAVPDRPTSVNVAAAIELLSDVVCDFPFLNDAHRAAWFAAVFTVVARPAFDGPAPLFMVDANTPSAGKTLLLLVTLLIVLGRPSAVMGAGGSDAEMEKRITALAIAGDPVVRLDNIGAGDTLGGPAPDRAPTADAWSGRVLGESRMYAGPLRAVWFATGNNTSLSADTPRRVVPIRLERPLERPEDRNPEQYRHEHLKGYVAANRGPLLAAALTVLRGDFAAGRPEPPGGRRTLGSFEGWSRLVRDAVVWAGLPDPLDARPALADAADPAANALSGVLRGLHAMAGGDGLPASGILSRIEENSAAHVELRDALQALCDCPPGRIPDSTTLGKKLATLRGRVCERLVLHGQFSGGGVKKWSVRPPPGPPLRPRPGRGWVGSVGRPPFRPKSATAKARPTTRSPTTCRTARSDVRDDLPAVPYPDPHSRTGDSDGAPL